ncbi:unnamed protein product [Calypogeia fissa]
MDWNKEPPHITPEVTEAGSRMIALSELRRDCGMTQQYVPYRDPAGQDGCMGATGTGIRFTVIVCQLSLRRGLVGNTTHYTCEVRVQSRRGTVTQGYGDRRGAGLGLPACLSPDG